MANLTKFNLSVRDIEAEHAPRAKAGRRGSVIAQGDEKR